MDIYEDEKAIYVKADLPGVVPDDIDIEVKDNVLRLRGERKREEEESKDGYRRVERRYGAFHRSITLPDTVDTAGIDASYKDGVLTLTLPKRPESQPREIKVVAH
jgi:HSP20 family protein